jgi:hypothetical protein
MRACHNARAAPHANSGIWQQRLYVLPQPPAVLADWGAGSANGFDRHQCQRVDFRGKRSQRGERSDYGKAEEASESTAEEVSDSTEQVTQGIKVRTRKSKKADDCEGQAQTLAREEDCAEKRTADEAAKPCG